jgi:hypothetical protein
MALPSSRNTTYAPGADIRSADLNAIQDCIIGGKHGTRELAIDASAFHVATDTLVGNGNNTWLTNVGGVTFGAGVTPKAVAPILLPVGSRIIQVEIFYLSDVVATQTLKVRRRILSTAVYSDLASVNNTAAGVIASQALVCNHVMLSGSVYQVSVTLTSAPQRIHGAIVTYDAP